MRETFTSIEPEDLDFLAELYQRAFAAPPWNELRSQSECMAILEFLSSFPGYCGRKLINEGGGVEGFYVARYLAPFKTFRVDELVVEPERQRTGIGSRLVRDAEALAAAQGATKVSLATLRGSPAELLYRKLGYADQDTAVHLEKHFFAC
jgi:GNAT superfamily N-acetyltransferase